MALALTSEQLRFVDGTLRMLADWREDLRKAENCGLDCQHYRMLADHAETQLTAIKKEFPPERFPR